MKEKISDDNKKLRWMKGKMLENERQKKAHRRRAVCFTSRRAYKEQRLTAVCTILCVWEKAFRFHRFSLLCSFIFVVGKKRRHIRLWFSMFFCQLKCAKSFAACTNRSNFFCFLFLLILAFGDIDFWINCCYIRILW